MSELSERQKRIIELWEEIEKEFNPLLKAAIEKYSEEFGMTFEDMWLWAHGISIDLEVYRYCTQMTFKIEQKR